VKLIETPELDEAAIRERLLGASLEGIAFADARVLGPNDPGIGRVIDRAHYVVGLPAPTLQALGLGGEQALDAHGSAREQTIEALREHLAGRLQRPLEVERDVKGIKRKIRVGDYLRAVEAGIGGEALRAAGMRGELTPFRFVLAVTGQGGARPSEVLSVLLGDAELPARIVRTFQGKGELSPLDLEGVRAAAAASEPEWLEASEPNSERDELSEEPREALQGGAMPGE
jgi:hypothetical protein